MRTRLIAMLPQFISKPLTSVRDKVRDYFRTMPYHGKARFCPVCEKTSNRFEQYGVVPRADALCVRCESLERHRLLWLYLTTRTDLFDGKSKAMLHVAPEPCLESHFRKRLGANYLTADLTRSRAMVQMDITDIKYPGESFDVIYCSHVLEHVTDDRRAMSEFHRVLRRSGWAILLVPIYDGLTFEDPSIVDPQERLKAFGQDDHVRRYGSDYVDRLRDAGFKVRVTRIDDLVGKADAIRMGLTPDSGEIYLCTK